MYRGRKQVPIAVNYDEQVIGEYVADLLVDNKVIVKVGTDRFLTKTQGLQLESYLRASDKEVGMLVNFGESLEFCRKVHSKRNKDTTI